MSRPLKQPQTKARAGGKWWNARGRTFYLIVERSRILVL